MAAMLVIILILAKFLYDAKNEVDVKTNLISVLGADLKIWQDQDGKNRAVIELLQTESVEQFLSIKSKDSTIIELQTEVEEYKRKIKDGSITIINTVTVYDTIYQEVDRKEYSSLFSSFLDSSIDNEWISATFGVKLDSLGVNRYVVDSSRLSLKVNNKYSVVFGKEPTGFLGLGKGKPFAEVKNHNPYTKTTNLRAFEVIAPPPKRFGLGLIGGYMISNNFTFEFAIGVGVSYNIIRF